MRVLIALLLVCASALPATGQRTSGPPGVIAWTTCASGEPVVEYFADPVPAHVVVHEARHVLHAHRNGGCERHLELLADDQFRLEMEADAFCAETEAGYARSLHDVAVQLDSNVAYDMWGWTYDEALRALEARCG